MGHEIVYGQEKGYSVEAMLFGSLLITEDEKKESIILLGKGNPFFITVNRNTKRRRRLMMVNALLEEQRIQPIVIKSKNNVPTVIEWNGKRYVLDHIDQFKPKRKAIKKYL